MKMKSTVHWVTCVVVSLLLLAFFGRHRAWQVAAVLTGANFLVIIGAGGAVGWQTASFRTNERVNARQFFLPGVLCLAVLYVISFIP